MFTFKRINKCWQNALMYKDDNVDFYLEENDWDDYGFQTSYCLHAGRKLTGNATKYLGNLRIMSVNQTEKDSYLLRDKLLFNELPDGFISLSMDIDLFLGVTRYLKTQEERNTFVNALHLILDKSSKYYSSDLETNTCFNKSLLRDNSSLENFALKKGRQLLNGTECFYNLRKESIGVKFTHVETHIDLKFNSVESEDFNIIPNGILVFIGKNGSGKSTSVYRLAKLMYTDPTLRFKLKNEVGELSPNNVGVSKIFLISYSPFDNFVLPTFNDIDYIRLLESGDDVYSRFVFCGIRDIVKEENSKKKEEESSTNDFVYDRQNNTMLKKISDLACEFATALNVVKTNKQTEWLDFLERCHETQPSLYYDAIKFNDDQKQESVKQIFLSMSTGHKFFMHSFVRVMAYIDDNSLLLFDEPENHLHPPLLSYLISEFRYLLQINRSVMFIATHSPVVVQETFASNVFIVRKYGDSTTITHPKIETYGANLSTISSEIFDLTTDITKYHDVIKFLYKKWGMAHSENVEKMIDKFESKLGHDLTNQMVSYLISLYIKDNDVEN